MMKEKIKKALLETGKFDKTEVDEAAELILSYSNVMLIMHKAMLENPVFSKMISLKNHNLKENKEL